MRLQRLFSCLGHEMAQILRCSTTSHQGTIRIWGAFEWLSQDDNPYHPRLVAWSVKQVSGDLRTRNIRRSPRRICRWPSPRLIFFHLFQCGRSLALTIDRVQPFFRQNIAPELRRGKKVLIAAHGNSLRALVKILDNVPEDKIVGLNIPTGVPKSSFRKAFETSGAPGL